MWPFINDVSPFSNLMTPLPPTLLSFYVSKFQHFWPPLPPPLRRRRLWMTPMYFDHLGLLKYCGFLHSEDILWEFPNLFHFIIDSLTLSKSAPCRNHLWKWPCNAPQPPFELSYRNKSISFWSHIYFNIKKHYSISKNNI